MPYPYQQYLPQQYQPMQTMQQMQFQQSLIRVTGVDGAKAYQMPPNSAVAMFDADRDVFYVKTTDGAGFPTLKAFEFRPMEFEQTQQQNNFVTHNELQQILESLRNEIKELASNGEQFIPQKQ